ncbi:MAG: hypothetical protein JWN62_4076 [Acidimicrobiales bacterium]|nr:hypothetical protein [Acidimicrobiales bacterium]
MNEYWGARDGAPRSVRIAADTDELVAQRDQIRAEGEPEAESDRSNLSGSDHSEQTAQLICELVRLSEEVENLKAALRTRAVIDQAKGIIMAAQRVDADHAFQVLREQSQHENRKLRDVAAEIVRNTSRD